MKTEEQPKFKVGDVIIAHIWKPIEIGVVFDVYEYYTFIEFFNEDSNSRLATIFNEYLEDWKLCEGMNDKDLCNQCKYRFKCWTN